MSMGTWKTGYFVHLVILKTIKIINDLQIRRINKKKTIILNKTFGSCLE